MQIIALNLSRQTTEDHLRKMFGKYGEVKSCNLMLDKETGKSKGFGFVDMTNDDEAAKAIEGLHGKIFGNHKIRVKLSTKSPGA